MRNTFRRINCFFTVLIFAIAFQSSTGKSWSGTHSKKAKASSGGGGGLTCPGSWTLTTLGAGSWTVPSNWNNASNSIEAIGGGGGGSGGDNWDSVNLQMCACDSGGAGGGGGAYAKITNISLTPNSSIAFNIGAGGVGGPLTSDVDCSSPIGGNGGVTWFLDQTTLKAANGVGGWTCTPFSNGGTATNSVGAVIFSGGNGKAITSAGASFGGGGGGSAGPNSNGTAATNVNGGSSGGGLGGAGGTWTTGGTIGTSNGQNYGGGGAGGTNSINNGNAGAQGVIKITCN